MMYVKLTTSRRSAMLWKIAPASVPISMLPILERHWIAASAKNIITAVILPGRWNVFVTCKFVIAMSLQILLLEMNSDVLLALECCAVSRPLLGPLHGGQRKIYMPPTRPSCLEDNVDLYTNSHKCYMSKIMKSFLYAKYERLMPNNKWLSQQWGLCIACYFSPNVGKSMIFMGRK